MGTELTSGKAATIVGRIDWRVGSAQIALFWAIHDAVSATGTQKTTRWATAIAAGVDSGVTFPRARIQFTICGTVAGLPVEFPVVAGFTADEDAIAALRGAPLPRHSAFPSRFDGLAVG